MIRLDMEDTNGTVLFVDPMKGVKILKEYGMNPQLFIEAGYSFSHAVYDSEENRDAAYERILNKVNEYLFPQIESVELGPVCPNDAAMPEYLRKPKKE